MSRGHGTGVLGRCLRLSRASLSFSACARRAVCKGAPWIIKAADLERADVKSAATARRLRRPPSGDPLQKVLEL